MVSTESEKGALASKKQRFIDVVNRTCNKRGLPIPSINFNGCDQETSDQLAHYHPEGNIICVSKLQLTKMTYDHIDSTAAHEVSHILVSDHSTKFRRQEAYSNIAGFKPPAGSVVIGGHSCISRE